MKKVSLVAVILAFAISTITLWLLESPLRYAFYFFEIALILVIFYLFGTTIKIKVKTRGCIAIKLDYASLAISMVLLVLTLFKIHTVLTMPCAVIVSLFLPGYALLRLLRFHSLKSRIEWIVLSFMLSIGVTSISFTAVLPFAAYRTILLSAIYVGISLSLLIKNRICKFNRIQEVCSEHRTDEYDLADVSILLWGTMFFVFVISYGYPQISLVPWADTVDHFSLSRLLLLAPDVYSSPYPWFHIICATIYEMVSPSVEIFQTGLAYLSIMVLFSFYAMAKAYLRDVDKHAPILATIFFFVFSGFGWFHFLKEKLQVSDPRIQFSLLVATNNVSYWDVGYGQGTWIWIWFRPITLGIAGLFVLLLFLIRMDTNKKTFFVLSYLITLSLAMIHFSELVFFTVLLFTLSLFLSSKINTHLKLSLFATLLSLMTFLILLPIYSFIGITIEISLFESLVPIAFVVLSILVDRVKQYIPYMPYTLKIKRETYAYYTALCISIILISLLFYWFVNSGNFTISMVRSVLGVPWLFYPVLLGICGLLATLAVVYIILNYSKHPIMIFVLMFILGILFGRALTYLNVQWFFTGYWERRIIPLTFSASAILASVLVLRFIKQIKLKHIFSLFMFSILIMAGITSTFLTIEMRKLNAERNVITSTEQVQITMLNKLDPKSYILTFSERSFSISGFVPFAWRINYFRNHIWSAKSPELPLNALFSTGYPAVIFLSQEDLVQLRNTFYGTSYITQHLLNVLPLHTVSEAKAMIYQISPIAPPSEKSNIVLVIPEICSDPRYLYAYDIMSLAGYNYTVAYICDMETILKAKTIVVPNEYFASKILELKRKLELPFEKLIVLNLDGSYGELAEIYYPKINIALTSATFGNATLRNPLYPLQISTNLTGITFTPFILETIASNNSLVLADDNASKFWHASAEICGNINFTQLTDDSELRALGENSLKIEISNNTYAQWQISYEFSNTTNLDLYDFISFYWYGKSNGVKYGIQVNTDTAGKYFYYEFTDSWQGWKKVILPMHIPDGSHSLYGVNFFKFTKEANWSNVKKIDFKHLDTNLNISHIFHLDRFAFERNILVNLKVVAEGDLQALNLLNLNQTKYIVIAQAKINETIPIPKYYFLDKVVSKKIFGKDAGSLTFTRYNATYSEIFIQIEMPVNANESCPVQAAFAISPSYKASKASNINGIFGTIKLPVEIMVMQVKLRANPIAYYDDETGVPFAFEVTRDQIRVVYLNFYPIIESLEKGSRELYLTIGDIVKSIMSNMSSYTYKSEPINAGNTAAFREATLQGSVTINFKAIIMQTENKLLAFTGGNTIHEIESNAKISLANFTDAVIKTNQIKIVPGYGFYIGAIVQNATLSLQGNQPRLISFLTNDSILSIKGNAITIRIENATLLLREPIIKVEGQASFRDLYIYHVRGQRVKVMGTDAEITGHITFTGTYGDTYTIAKDCDFSGIVKPSEPLYKYDEWRFLIEMFPYLLIAAISYLVFSFLKILRRDN
ncbi:MAG: hypothetical protein QW385_08440 [Thermoproteota archaeon]